jgi:hypothetical protein
MTANWNADLCDQTALLFRRNRQRKELEAIERERELDTLLYEASHNQRAQDYFEALERLEARHDERK